MKSLISKLVICFLFFHCCYAFSAEENFLLVNGLTNESVMVFGPSIDERMSPCSTFKIPLSLMGYDMEVLENEDKPVWDFHEGYDTFLDSWKSPICPQSWMKYSCVWYSKLLALELGMSTIESYLSEFEYGNQDISGGLPRPGTINPAWINSSLQITPREQVNFIRKMIQKKLPISSYALQMTKAILFNEELVNGWKLFGKTAYSKTLQFSWFVGWVEKEEEFYPFAYCIRDKQIDLDKRIPRVKQLLSQADILR